LVKSGFNVVRVGDVGWRSFRFSHKCIFCVLGTQGASGSPGNVACRW
jgi:hypothetical protein